MTADGLTHQDLLALTPDACQRMVSIRGLP